MFHFFGLWIHYDHHPFSFQNRSSLSTSLEEVKLHLSFLGVSPISIHKALHIKLYLSMNSFKKSNLFCDYQNLSPLDDCELLKEYALCSEILGISGNKSWFPTFAEENPFSSNTCPFLLVREELCSSVCIHLSNLNIVFQSF